LHGRHALPNQGAGGDGGYLIAEEEEHKHQGQRDPEDNGDGFRTGHSAFLCLGWI
jgi:hypothetical protein